MQLQLLISVSVKVQKIVQQVGLNLIFLNFLNIYDTDVTISEEITDVATIITTMVLQKKKSTTVSINLDEVLSDSDYKFEL